MAENKESATLNWPNGLTVLRLFMAGFVIWFALAPELSSRLIAGGLFAIAAITDYVDGQLARNTNSITTFGKILDPIADKFLVLGGFGVLSYLGMFPYWILIPIVLREVSITLIRFYFLWKGTAVAAVKSGKQKTTMQIVAIAAVYLKLIFRDHAVTFFSHDSGAILTRVLDTGMYLTLIIALILTLYSGWIFFKNNWHLLQGAQPTRG